MGPVIVAGAAALVAWVLWPIIRGNRPGPPALTGSAPACPRCGPRLEADARFCSECGAPTASQPPP